MSEFRLTAAQRRRLELQLRATRDTGLYRRTLAVLEAAAGRPIAEVVRLLRTSPRSVYSWLASYDLARDPAGLVDGRVAGVRLRTPVPLARTGVAVRRNPSRPDASTSDRKPLKRFPDDPNAAEARKRLDALTRKSRTVCPSCLAGLDEGC